MVSIRQVNLSGRGNLKAILVGKPLYQQPIDNAPFKSFHNVLALFPSKKKPNTVIATFAVLVF